MNTVHVPELFPVLNQPPVLENYNAFVTDPVLGQGLRREGADWAEADLSAFGERTGSAEWIEWGHRANKFPPDYHNLMAAGVAGKVHCWPWREPRRGAYY